MAINNLLISDEGIYTCDVSNLCNSVSSENADLQVLEIAVDAGADIVICNGSYDTLQANALSNHPTLSGELIFHWSPAVTLSNSEISNPVASPFVGTN